MFDCPTTVPASCRIAPPVRSQRSWRARTVKRGWRPQVGRQHAHRVVVLVPPSHHVGVEDANPAGRRSGCCDATVVKPCGGEEQVDSGPSSGPTSSQPSASAVVRPRPATAASELAAFDRSGGGLRLAVVPVLAGVPSNGRNRGHASWAERDGGVRRAPRAGWSGLRRSGLALDLAQGLGHGKTAQQPRPVWGVARFRDQACRIAAHAEARSSGKGDPPTATQSPTVMGVSLERTETTAGGPGNDAEPANRSACLNHIN